MKKVISYIVVLVVVVLVGLALERYCHRFPTEGEMSNYHESHFTTKLVKLESKEYTKANGGECIVFKGLHKPSGADEVYFVEAGRRWVMPWNDYNWKSEDRD